eukprot:7627081-Alexandrium_andersonii.AAC.1
MRRGDPCSAEPILPAEVAAISTAPRARARCAGASRSWLRHGGCGSPCEHGAAGPVARRCGARGCGLRTSDASAA